MDLYRDGIAPILFSGLKADPEWLHHQTLNLLGQIELVPGPALALAVRDRLYHTFGFASPALHQTLWGLRFANPVGLAAGFDKDGTAVTLWPCLGFGYAELGTVTSQAQLGNPRPRLFRLRADRAVINRMGFNNRGAATLAAVLQVAAQRRQAMLQALDREHLPPWADAPVGINLGKSKLTPLADAAMDYVISFRQLQPWGDYFVVNVSSPNTPGLRSLQAIDQLAPILAALQNENSLGKPLLVKIAPDLADDDIRELVRLAQQYHLAGIIATNTTLQRSGLQTQAMVPGGYDPQAEAGGLSGAPLANRSTAVIRLIWQEAEGRLPIVGVGGIFTAEDAWEKITAGASLIQVYTGLVYEGPGLIRRVLQGLVDRLHQQGWSHMSQAIGSAHREAV